MEENIFFQIIKNKALITSLVSWMIAQTIKVALGIWREKRFNFKWFIGTGGMPSSHVAGMMALATSVGFVTGFSSYQFAVALVVALIVMFDAQGVRRSAGKQAIILNKFLDDIYWGKRIEDQKLKEFLGHTPIEVFAGALIGILISVIAYGLW